MARLFALIANRPDLAPWVFAAEATLLAEPARHAALGWGVGFYQGGEVLLRRRPIDERPTLPIAASLSDVRTDTLVGHVRTATVGSMRTENTHPFRYRQWLFAHTGTIAGFASLRDRLAASLPTFLARDVRGDTDSELLFHLFLSFLHDAGRLDHASVAPADIRAALRATLALVDGLSAEEGAPPEGCNLVVTDGETLVAVHSRANMSFRLFQGRHDVDELLGPDGPHRPRIPDPTAVRACLLVADHAGDAPRFSPVADRSIITLTRAVAPSSEPL